MKNLTDKITIGFIIFVTISLFLAPLLFIFAFIFLLPEYGTKPTLPWLHAE
ncbi:MULTISPECIES: hypothetical protein [Priestia]|uniref:hypothetical protein n=1 Tax=Priestia TaxID=2800373 RepID=UPI0016722468|nr:hypothetical protein [Priestia megaterium]